MSHDDRISIPLLSNINLQVPCSAKQGDQSRRLDARSDARHLRNFNPTRLRFLERHPNRENAIL